MHCSQTCRSVRGPQEATLPSTHSHCHPGTSQIRRVRLRNAETCSRSEVLATEFKPSFNAKSRAASIAERLPALVTSGLLRALHSLLCQEVNKLSTQETSPSSMKSASPPTAPLTPLPGVSGPVVVGSVLLPTAAFCTGSRAGLLDWTGDLRRQGMCFLCTPQHVAGIMFAELN